MRAILSGMNVDMELLKKYHNLAQIAREGEVGVEVLQQLADELPEFFPTPETISAAAAKTSRSEEDLPTLRANAIQNVEAARKTNENVVHGLGHESVAEHAYFNFDLVDVSRAVVNWVEEQRLASFTEKSMRYVKFGKDFLIPNEIASSKYNDKFVALMNKNFELYTQTYDLILPILRAENPVLVEDMNSPDKSKSVVAKNKLEGMAKEDARYCLPYATQTQLELSLNGRSLERMIRILNSAPIAEAAELGQRLLMESQELAPSLIKYPEKTKYLSETRQGLEGFVAELQKKLENIGEQTVIPYVGNANLPHGPKVIDYDKMGDDKIVLALLTANSDKPYGYWSQKLPAITRDEKHALIKKALTDIQRHDSVFREFEFVDLTYEAEISEAAYAQLKRQRMMTLIKQPETSDIGYVIPLNVEKAGQTAAYKNSYAESRALFEEMLPDLGRHAALYSLPLSNMTRVYFKVNLRELHSMARHREDKFAQWEIRKMQTDADDIARNLYPLSTILLCGKDKFCDKYSGVFPSEQ